METQKYDSHMVLVVDKQIEIKRENVMANSEKVLVFKESLLLPFLGNFKNGNCFDQQVIPFLLKEIFKNGNTFYVERNSAETDPTIKQIIPYVTIWRNEKVFVYERGSKGGEQRLHKKLSLGIGGHINPIDGKGTEGYEEALWRELKEETCLLKTKNFNINESIRGLLYDDSNDVGKVHFGIIHYLDLLPSESMHFKDASIIPVGFMSDNDLVKNKSSFENWSQLTMSQFMV